MDEKQTESLIVDLVDVGTGKIAHLNMGLCPDVVEGHDTRDDDCPACKILMRAAVAMATAPKT